MPRTQPVDQRWLFYYGGSFRGHRLRCPACGRKCAVWYALWDDDLRHSLWFWLCDEHGPVMPLER